MNIAALSRRTGVAPDTLRKWEQRYAILRPTRTAGGQRRYSELDVARVEWLRARLAEGYRISEAAALLGGTGGDVPAEPAELRDAMLRAIRDADPDRLGSLLDQAFALHPVELALGEIGLAVLACAPGERHELGLLMLGVLLRADGWQVAYLGADTPVADAVELAERLSAQVLGLSVAMPERLDALRGLEAPRGTRLVLGGSAVSPAVAAELGAEYLDSSLG